MIKTPIDLYNFVSNTETPNLYTAAYQSEVKYFWHGDESILRFINTDHRIVNRTILPLKRGIRLPWGTRRSGPSNGDI